METFGNNQTSSNLSNEAATSIEERSSVELKEAELASNNTKQQNFDDDDEEDEDLFEEAMAEFDERSETDESSYHDLDEPVELLTQLVTNEATRVLNQEINGFQNFIQQRRQDIRAELENLANRPLAQNSQTRTRLESLLNTSGSASLNQNQTSNQTSSSYRSAAVRSEIDELSQMTRVSNVLSTAGSQIESTLRNIIQNRIRPISTASNQQNQQPTQAETRLTATNQRTVLNENRTANEITIEEMTREQIVNDISSLVHQQLVSSALRSNFRTALEQRIMNRMRQIGI